MTNVIPFPITRARPHMTIADLRRGVSLAKLAHDETVDMNARWNAVADLLELPLRPDARREWAAYGCDLLADLKGGAA